MNKKTNTLKFYGRSVGDSSVGIPSVEFDIDTGLFLDKDTIEMLNNETNIKRFKTYREYLLHEIAKLFYELHDNGTVKVDTNEFELSGKEEDVPFDWRYYYGYEEMKEDKK